MMGRNKKRGTPGSTSFACLRRRALSSRSWMARFGSFVCVRHRARVARAMARLLATMVLLAIPFAHAGVAPTGLHEDVIFTAYARLAGNAERMRRLLSPLTTWRMQRQLQKAHERLSEQAIDLAHERFTLYVPKKVPPAAGHALLVFVSP